MRARIAIIALMSLLMACGKKKGPQPAAPVDVLLSAPAMDEVCTTGTVISDTQSAVQFSWAASANTDSYSIMVTNLLTHATTAQNTTTTQVTVTLARNTPYSWYVISRSGKVPNSPATSSIWKFYNSGPGIVNYAPYPAEITAPKAGAKVSSTTVDLTWIGSSPTAGAVLTYDVYFGTIDTPPKIKDNLTDSFVHNQSVVAGATYYWKVITKDANGNTSDSGLFMFGVN